MWRKLVWATSSVSFGTMELDLKLSKKAASIVLKNHLRTKYRFFLSWCSLRKEILTIFMKKRKKEPFLALAPLFLRFRQNEKKNRPLICKISDNFYFSHFWIWWLFLPGDFLHPSEEAFYGCRILIFEISSK